MLASCVMAQAVSEFDSRYAGPDSLSLLLKTFQLLTCRETVLKWQLISLGSPNIEIQYFGQIGYFDWAELSEGAAVFMLHLLGRSFCPTKEKILALSSQVVLIHCVLVKVCRPVRKWVWFSFSYSAETFSGFFS